MSFLIMPQESRKYQKEFQIQKQQSGQKGEKQQAAGAKLLLLNWWQMEKNKTEILGIPRNIYSVFSLKLPFELPFQPSTIS